MRKLSSTLSSKGQVTIPQEIRTRLGLKEGDRVEFVIEAGRTVLRPGRNRTNPFEAFASALQTFSGGMMEINAWMSELREGKPRP
jgi:antitoxin PrlF